MEVSWQRRFLSFLISIPCRIKLFNRKAMPSRIEKVLVMQLDYLGDIVVSTPALKALRNILPTAFIDLLTSSENKNYIENFPFVNRIFYIKNPLHLGRSAAHCRDFYKLISDLPKEKYDLIIELSGKLTNQLLLFFVKAKYKIGQDPTGDFYYLDRQIRSKAYHQIDRNLDAVRTVSPFQGNEGAPRPWNPATDEDRKMVGELLKKEMILNMRYIVMHIAASWKQKQWPAERWAQVADFFAENNKKVIFIGNFQENQYIKEAQMFMRSRKSLNLAGRLSMGETLALMERSELFVGNDSGPMHLAAVVNLKGIVIFGPGDVERWGYPALHNIIYHKVKCSPCPQFAFRKKCIKNLMVCKGLMEITVHEVIETCKKALL